MRHWIASSSAATALLFALPAFAQGSVASQEKTIPGGTLLVIAYILFTVMVLGYLALLSFRQRALDRDIAGLEKRLDELADIDA